MEEEAAGTVLALLCRGAGALFLSQAVAGLPAADAWQGWSFRGKALGFSPLSLQSLPSVFSETMRFFNILRGAVR